MKLSDRLAKLEARNGGRQRQRVLRHIIEGAMQAERQAKAHALAAAHNPGTFHIFRMVVETIHV